MISQILFQQPSALGCRLLLLSAVCGLRPAACGRQGGGLRAVGCEMRAAGCGLRVAGRRGGDG